MKTFLLLLLFPAILFAQPAKEERQLIGLIVNTPPDHIDSNDYYLIVQGLPSVKLKAGQTFIAQSTWKKEGDSIVTIGAGTVQEIDDLVGLRLKLYTGKTVKEGDMALFLVPLQKPEIDTLFFKMARLGIGFKSVTDSSFYERNAMLSDPGYYPTQHLLNAMAEDIKYTGEMMAKMNDAQDQEIKFGGYKGQKLFAMMKSIKGEDVFQFLRYVYARPDKYKAHDWKVSETFATWAINGAPKVL